MHKLLVIIPLLILTPALASLGVDGSADLNGDIWNCLIQKTGISFGIRLLSTTSGDPDQNIFSGKDIENAIVVGNTDPYTMDLINSVLNHGNNSIFLWLVIKDKRSWTSSCENNIQSIQTWVDALKAKGFKLGIQTSSFDWISITCNTHRFKDLPLWYIGDPRPSFKDFKSFGGWSKPTMKKSLKNQSMCRTKVGINWKPLCM